MNSLRVSFFMTGDFPEGAANASRMKEYLKGLQKLGHTCELNVLWQSGFSGAEVNQDISGLWDKVPFRFFNNRRRRPVEYIGRFINTLRAWSNAFLYVVKNRREIDVAYLYCPDVYYFFPVFIALWLCRIPRVTERTELKSGLYTQPGKKKNLFYYLNRLDERFCHLWSGQGVVISEKLLQHYVKRFGESRMALIPVIADLERYKPGIATATKGTIGYIGSFGIKDGVPGMLKAFASASLKMTGLRLKLMGYCENPAAISRLIDQFKLHDLVEMCGLLTYDEVPAQMASCDLLLVNRINSVYANFGFPTKLAEYLALVIPTIATKVGDVELYLEHKKNAYLINPENDTELANAILSRYAEYEKWNEMGKNGRQVVVEHFNREVCSKKLEKVFYKALKK
ncbi:MAG: glycosyltransferase [Flavobacteriaceae bacterium]|nr:glycosyltransferase [Flavobacteriaceae bacterium]